MYKRNPKTWLVMAALLVGMVSTTGGQIVYVDADATGSNDGTSWPNAYNYLQDALAEATYNLDVNEIRVAQGTYRPDEDSNNPDGTGYRTATFKLINGVALKGGYAGFAGADPNARDIEAYETILSGDLDGNDVHVNEPGDLGVEPTRWENSYHVVASIENDETALVDGFVITGGHASSGEKSSDWRGGAIYLSNSKARIMSCIIRYNWSCRGGGLYSRDGSPTMSGCTVRGNVTGTKNSWESMGGGICCRGSSFEITNCMITENTALGRFSYGGGIYRGVGPIRNCVITRNFAQDSGGAFNDYKGSIVDCNISYNIAGRDSGGLRFCDGPIVNCTICYNRAHEEDTGAIGGSGDVINCIITGNSSGRDAGAMGNCYGIVANCIISGNQAGRNGGALRTFTGVLTNCTIANNFAGGQGGAIHDGQVLISNSIISRNSSGDSSVLSACSVPSYSCMQEDSNGIGCIVIDPRFVEGGYWADMNDANVGVEPDDPNAVWVDGDYHLLTGSPCIDSADNNSVPPDVPDLDGDGNTTEPIPWDIEGNPRIADGNNDGNSVVDMGAYEFFMSPIEVQMKLTPQALNPGSKGNWVKAHFVLPEGFSDEDVDANTPAVAQPGGIESDYMNVFINGDDGLVEIEAAFNRAELCSIVTDGEPMEVRVEGWFTSGRQFYGTDTIKITNNYLQYLAGLASYWLETGCAKPDWCSGLDLDKNSLVNFSDFTLFNGCCIEVIKE